MEALRWLEYLRPDGKVVVNDYQINPMPVVSGVAEYSDKILDELKAKASDVTVVNAFDAAVAIGNPRVLNIVLLGTIIKMMRLTEIDWNSIIAEEVKADFVKLNQTALAKGLALV
jgi:indolepyruvate ferredoxin oxidoreductase beta subunit